MWRNFFYNPKTSFGGLLCLAGVTLCFLKEKDAGIGLIGFGAAFIGVASKDNDK